MKRAALLLLLTLGWIMSLAGPASAKIALGEWFKAEKQSFWIRIPADWKKIPVNQREKYLIARWQGPAKTVNLKRLGSATFRASASIVWLETKPLGATTRPSEPNRGDKEDGGEKDEISEAERKKLLKERSQRITARDFKQWLNNFSGFTGVRMVHEKEIKVAKRSAWEYEFLSKTNQQVNFKHYAVSVKASEHHEVIFIYSVLEDEYKRWRALFKKCVNTLKIKLPEPARSETRGGVASKNTAETDPEGTGTSPLPFPDLLITHHGKIVEGRVEEQDGGFRVQLGEAFIEVPADLVMRVEYGNPERFTPQTEEEEAMAAKGYMRFRGRWVLKSRYELEMKRERKKLMERIEVLKAHSDPSNPWRLRSTRFVLETTTSEELLEHYGAILEAHIDAFENRLKVNVTNEARKRKPTVRIFKDKAEYMSFTKARGTAGYFSLADNSLHLYHNFEDPGFTEYVLLHEGTHLLNYLTNPQFAARPHWIEEGTAEYFGSSKISRDRWGKLLFEPGQILGNRLLLVHNRVSSGKANKLRDALATQSYKYEDYAYWWSFTHFMVNHPKYGARFIKYYRKLYSLKGVEKVDLGSFFKVTPEASVGLLERSLGIRDWDALQQEWEDFIDVHAGQVGGFGWMVLGRDLYFESFKEKDKDQDKEREKKVAMLHRSLEALDTAIDGKGYKKAGAYYYRCMVFKELDRNEEALKDIQEAIGLDALNARYYSRRASLRYLQDEKEKALEDMRIAIALSPFDLMLPLILEEMTQGIYVDLSRG